MIFEFSGYYFPKYIDLDIQYDGMLVYFLIIIFFVDKLHYFIFIEK